MQKDNFQGHNNIHPAASSRNVNVAPFQGRLLETTHLPHGEYYPLYAEKMHKILIALYMVTDLVETNHAVKDALRERATQALSFIYELNYSDESQRHTEKLHDIHILLSECSSYFDVLFRTGYVSPMNYQVILTEMHHLQDTLHTQYKTWCETRKGTRTFPSDFQLPINFFNADEQEENKGQAKETPTILTPSTTDEEISNAEPDIKDSDEEAIFVPKTSMSSLVERYKNKRTATTSAKPKVRAQREPQINEAKEARKANILKILKQKKDASITDICSLFKDCSSKTIQRDLNELIEEKKVIKKGSRRWSTYNLVR